MIGAAAPEPDRLAAPQVPRRVTALLVITLVAATAYQWHVGGGWNVMSRLAVIRSVYHDHSLCINRSHHRTGDKAEYPPGSGRYYSDKPVGAQVLGLLGYAVGFEVPAWFGVQRSLRLEIAVVVATFCAVGVPTIALAVAMLYFLVGLGFALPVALGTVLTYCLATLAWPYSTVYYGHQPAAAFAMGSFVAAWGACRARSRWLAAAGGLLGAWGVVSDLPAAILAGIVFGYLVTGDRRLALPYLLGSLPPLLLQLGVNQVCFQSPFRFGYMFEVQPEFARPESWIRLPRWDALVGLLFSGDKGLLALTPCVAFAAWGLVELIRDPEHRRIGVVCAAATVTYLLYNASHYMWEGGTCFGPRHLVAMLPFLSVGFAAVAPRLTGLLHPLWMVAVSWSALVMFAAVCSAAEPAYTLFSGSPTAIDTVALFSHANTLWPNLGMVLGLPNMAAFLVHGAVLLVLVVLLQRAARVPTTVHDNAP